LIYAPETDRSRTDLDAITASIRRGLHSASGRLRDIDHCLGTKRWRAGSASACCSARSSSRLRSTGRARTF
jgi:hypothetical protein